VAFVLSDKAEQARKLEAGENVSAELLFVDRAVER
jgi:hypothetical protein